VERVIYSNVIFSAEELPAAAGGGPGAVLLTAVDMDTRKRHDFPLSAEGVEKLIGDLGGVPAKQNGGIEVVKDMPPFPPPGQRE
jgi:hypothetical protein